ncbi:hypothetical protein SHIRM173S_09426 [Streptomyces hirsutus]
MAGITAPNTDRPTTQPVTNTNPFRRPQAFRHDDDGVDRKRTGGATGRQTRNITQHFTHA